MLITTEVPTEKECQCTLFLSVFINYKSKITGYRFLPGFLISDLV